MKTHRLFWVATIVLAAFIPAFAQSSTDIPYLTDAGYGPIVLGMKSRHIPSHIDGFYSRKDKEKVDGDNIYDMKRYGYNVMNVSTGHHNRFVQRIEICDPQVAAQLSDGTIVHIGESLADLVAATRATGIEYNDLDGPTIRYGSFTFKISADFTPEALKMVNANPSLNRELTPSDFTSAAKVTSIAVEMLED